MNDSGLFLVDILVNATGALVMVFLVFISREYVPEPTIDPPSPRVGVMKIDIDIKGVDKEKYPNDSNSKALRDTLFKLCMPPGDNNCIGPRSLFNEKVNVFKNEENGEPLFAGSVFGLPNFNINQSKLTILFPCPKPGAWKFTLDYGTVYSNHIPKSRNYTGSFELIGVNVAESKIEDEVCGTEMSSQINAECKWRVMGNVQCNAE